MQIVRFLKPSMSKVPRETKPPKAIQIANSKVAKDKYFADEGEHGI